MNKSFFSNIKSNNFVGANKQFRTAIADKVLEVLATKKAQLADGMGLKESTKEDKRVARNIAMNKDPKGYAKAIHKAKTKQLRQEDLDDTDTSAEKDKEAEKKDEKEMCEWWEGESLSEADERGSGPAMKKSPEYKPRAPGRHGHSPKLISTGHPIAHLQTHKDYHKSMGNKIKIRLRGPRTGGRGNQHDVKPEHATHFSVYKRD